MSLTGDKAASIPGLQSCGSVGRSCPTFEQAPLFLGPLEAPHVPSPITAKPEEPGGEGGGWKGKRRGRFHRETSPLSCRAPRAGMPAALPHWKRTTLSHPALRVLLPALRPYGDSHKQGPEPRPGAEGAARRSSKEEQRNSPVLQSTGGRGVRGGTIPPAHTPVWAVSAEEQCRRHFSPHPLWYKPKQLSALHIFPCNLSLRYTSDLLISQMGKGSSAKL